MQYICGVGDMNYIARLIRQTRLKQIFEIQQLKTWNEINDICFWSEHLQGMGDNSVSHKYWAKDVTETVRWQWLTARTGYVKLLGLQHSRAGQ